MRKVSFAVVLISLLALPGFSQLVVVEGALRAGGNMLGKGITEAIASRIARVAAPLAIEPIRALPAFSMTSFNASTLDLTNINNGRGYEFMNYHSKYLNSLGKDVTFEGFFLPTVEALGKELIAPMSKPTHASQALNDAAFKALKMPSGFFGVKVASQSGAADVLVLDMHTGEWQSFQKFLGGIKTPQKPLTK